MAQTDKISLKINRQEALKQGFYDGRFRTRKVKDAKKDLNKRWCKLNFDRNTSV